MEMLESMTAAGMIKMRRTQHGIRRYDLDSLQGNLKRMINPANFPEGRPVIDRMVTPNEAAKALGVTTRTLRNWEAAGKIKATKNKKGRKIYDLDSVVYED
ncbi:MAG: MerR family DNA-binding transcriptional regulator [Moorea sp. SIO4A1]|uniref:MerR family DNA-binding transcriptional regulator n=2 Tax=unclassified Moorena TaxID=2683338 RepID=UPI00144E78DB|nr:MerR family DNA-binding transcriptional regulator [Moorena sp. SIO4A1]NEQ62657.1 MerR family DNA-binding transcriptional regulator [Moorena sp. SIO4A1]